LQVNPYRKLLARLACRIDEAVSRPRPVMSKSAPSSSVPPEWEWMTTPEGVTYDAGSDTAALMDAQMRHLFDAAQSVVYAWRWSDRPEVKIGLTTVGTARWESDVARRSTDENPASCVVRHRVLIGFAAVDVEQLRAAERWAHDRHAADRLADPYTGNPTEWFAIGRNDAADTLVAVGHRYGGYAVTSRET
jgi:ligand-binding sensor domain-containing protein